MRYEMSSVAKNYATRWGKATPPPWMADRIRRDEGVKKLCKILHTTRRFICDPLLTLALGSPSVDPTLLERWLLRHHKMAVVGESIKEALTRNYGKEVAELAESLI